MGGYVAPFLDPATVDPNLARRFSNTLGSEFDLLVSLTMTDARGPEGGRTLCNRLDKSLDDGSYDG